MKNNTMVVPDVNNDGNNTVLSTGTSESDNIAQSAVSFDNVVSIHTVALIKKQDSILFHGLIQNVEQEETC